MLGRQLELLWWEQAVVLKKQHVHLVKPHKRMVAQWMLKQLQLG